MQIEVWKPVVGYEELYEVSNMGNVRSVDKTTRDGRFWKGRQLRKHYAGSGYVQTVLSVDGVYRHEYIHRLVANAFIPNPDNKPEVNHINGDKNNNSVENLEWVTKSENGLHSFRVLGRKPSYNNKGKASKRRKLNNDQLEIVRTSSKSCYALAREFGVSDTVIQRIRRGESYRVQAP